MALLLITSVLSNAEPKHTLVSLLTSCTANGRAGTGTKPSGNADLVEAIDAVANWGAHQAGAAEGRVQITRVCPYDYWNGSHSYQSDCRCAHHDAPPESALT